MEILRTNWQFNDEGQKCVDNFLEASLDATLVMDELKMNREIESMTEEEMERIWEMEMKLIDEVA